MRFVPKELKLTADISRGRQNWKQYLKTAVSVALTLGLIYFLVGLLAQGLAVSIPDKWEADLFSGVAFPEPEDVPELEAARKIFEKLSADPGLRSLPYRLVLIDTSDPNALAFPGGTVGVTRGLLETVRGERGLAMVLGHELGHHQRRHSLKRLGRSILFRVTTAVLFGDSQGIVDATLDMESARYSRSQEREADTFGLRLVHAHYGDTEGALEFFHIIHDAYETKNARWKTLFASHPYTPNRIAYLQELQQELGTASGTR